jgi:hypothetical protein
VRPDCEHGGRRDRDKQVRIGKRRGRIRVVYRPGSPMTRLPAKTSCRPKCALHHGTNCGPIYGGDDSQGTRISLLVGSIIREFFTAPRHAENRAGFTGRSEIWSFTHAGWPVSKKDPALGVLDYALKRIAAARSDGEAARHIAAIRLQKTSPYRPARYPARAVRPSPGLVGRGNIRKPPGGKKGSSVGKRVVHCEFAARPDMEPPAGSPFR